MASIDELKDVLKETLEERGVLSELRAKIRAEIFNSLNDKASQKVPLSNENLIVNELIKEYMIFNGYTHSLSVFIPETGQPERSPFDRNFIAKKLKIQEDSKSKEVPLLYGNQHIFDTILNTLIGLSFGLKELVNREVDENIRSEPLNNRFPRKEDVFNNTNMQIGKKEVRIYEDIFNLDNPKPFTLK